MKPHPSSCFWLAEREGAEEAEKQAVTQEEEGPETAVTPEPSEHLGARIPSALGQVENEGFRPHQDLKLSVFVMVSFLQMIPHAEVQDDKQINTAAWGEAGAPEMTTVTASTLAGNTTFRASRLINHFTHINHFVLPQS